MAGYMKTGSCLSLMQTRHEFLAFGVFVVLGLASASLQSCGNFVPEEETRHEYRLQLQGGTDNQHRQFASLVSDFNASVGYGILEYAMPQDSANSPLTLIEALEHSTGKLGFGGVVVVTSQKGLRTTHVESMKIQLDRDYVTRRIPSWRGQKSYNELRLLFFHEVGHGLGFAHAGITSDVMYPDLVGEKDYSAFYAKVRQLIESRTP